MIELLNDIDTKLFLILNGFHHPVLDYIMELISTRWVWIPFYAYMLYVLIVNFGKQSTYIVLGTVLVIVLCDQLSVNAFKNVFERLRPCHNPAIQELVHIVNNHCGGQFGFVSSHAANVFGLAAFLGYFLKRVDKQWLPFLFVWAAVVSYSRIYLGVHYPGDIIVGGVLGVFVAWLVRKFVAFLDKKLNLKIQI